MTLLPSLWVAAGFPLMADNFYQLEAEGSLESVWHLPLSTPVTNHMLPLELPPRSFWEMITLCPEYFAMAFQKGKFAACACVRGACWERNSWLQISSSL